MCGFGTSWVLEGLKALPPHALDMLTEPRAPSTRRLYALKWDIVAAIEISTHMSRATVSSWAWSKITAIWNIDFAAGWSSQNTFTRVYKLDVLSLASEVLSVSH